MNPSEFGPDRRMSKVENGVTRKETTTVNDTNYDVIKLEKHLESNPELGLSVDMPLSDPRIHDAVQEGNTYWATKSGESLGPSHFINLWNKSKSMNANLELDQFLEELKLSHADWSEHIKSIQFAKDNLNRPIWLYGDEKHHQHPFDGMHRLTRAYLENLPTVKVIIWDSLPDDAKLESL